MVNIALWADSDCSDLVLISVVQTLLHSRRVLYSLPF
jgi:hypothetical protein